MNFERLCLKCMKETIYNGYCSFCGTKTDFAQEPLFALPAGSILHGRYLVGSVLGHGGYGITYIGLDLKNNMRVAIKEFMPDGLSTRVPGTTTVTIHSNSEDYLYGRGKFIDEARIIYKNNSNPNIISVSSLFEENNTAYYIMEYLEGCDLKRYITQKGGKLPYSEAIRLLTPIFDALSAVHQQFIIHRDVSPDNIYVCKNGQVKLLDFGAARVALIGKSKSLSIILKRGYAPEEQYRSHGHQGPWTDVYAIAATLYRCITGELPPEATERLFKDELIPPSNFSRDLPINAERAIIKALSVKAEDRYQSIEEFKAALAGNLFNSPARQVIYKQVPQHQYSNYSEGYYTSLIGKRIGAQFVDSIFVSLIPVFLFVVYSIEISQFFISIFIAGFLYGSIFEATLGSTLGKRLTGLMTADVCGNKLGAGRVLLRNIIKYCPAGINVFLPYTAGGTFIIINCFSALLNTKNQTLHDIVAGSFVTIESLTSQRLYLNQNYMKAQIFSGSELDVNAQMPAGREYGMKIKMSAEIECISGYYKGSKFEIKDILTLGRNPKACNIIFPDGTRGVSGIHCELRFDNSTNSLIIKDLHSTYGTLASGQRLKADQTAVLYDGDSFAIGEDNKFIVNIK